MKANEPEVSRSATVDEMLVLMACIQHYRLLDWYAAKTMQQKSR